MGKTFAENLILARSKTGMTQKELARKSGLSTQQLAGYEVGDSGSISSPPLTHVIKLASVLGISIDDLVPIHKFNAEPSLANLIAEIDRLKSDLRESEDLVEHLQDKRTELQREVEMLRKAAGDASAELYKAVGWICREVEAGTKSATHWAIRLGSSAKVLEAAIAKGGSNG